ncbi:MAG: ABC-type transport auxiliary lipoprotein family protein [Brevundimonas sp.]|uniref:ABC-type transport auxiliary lipoprotein family protein n=1 Tax=Brevundimonas sp. TaxID=1871086 RepID=UPI0027156D96|nr:ABC-type transport auxiliary lipoprotein family protein [Brevundimonas sp.]MDO9589158.1 ABC-type transport auxiliary lipoprotein family protein [Brevundimonas sp.]MDP3656276.1 ABC-type transport auxiliary lipoprotein family protein [Brevundimonas sp.]MDZ4112678.1 ABC-type transport auxiliary lipoprotein family protein [Brevundimonas sp.]
MIRLPLLRLAVAAAGALAVSACALLSTPEPVQTYRFGSPPAAGAAALVSPRQVSLRRVEFPEAVRGDRLLGATGTETAYIKGARWVSPAADLYMESLENAFAAQATRVRLIGPRELTRGERTLDVDVRSFEARYGAPGMAPTISVTARVRLLAMPDRTVAAERLFTVEQPASANRISAIVEAFDLATRDLNTQIVAWTDSNAG